MRKWLSMLCVTLVLWGCTSQPVTEPNKNVCGFTCETSDMSEYDLLSDTSHVFLSANYEEALEMLKNETFNGILYFGYPSCPWCKEAVVEMNDAATLFELTIYYINKKSDFNLMHSELEEEIALLLNASYPLDQDEEGNPHLYVPEVVVVKEGKIVDHHTGTLEEHDAHVREMNEDEKAKLEKRYIDMFEKLKK